MKPVLRPALAVAALALAATATAVAPATAAAAPQHTTATQGKYCTYIVDTGQGGCFDTRAQAARFGGTRADYKVLGKMWTDANSGGRELALRGSVGCGWRYPEFNALSKWDFNDNISSVEGVTCPITLWEHADFRGAKQTYHGYVPYIGDAMNDKASSVSFDLR
ncbi:hypothetical protein ACH4FX_00095 [Streptomyces sp. NPDC018019]|uniref:hypothetical protein n=1 Tax=Streptomyces sp. NPDC018019 TaxID=3365030 RepID=UPI0037982566